MPSIPSGFFLSGIHNSNGMAIFETFCDRNFYGEGFLARRPTHKLEDHPLSAVRDCLFSIFAATLHNWRTSLQLQPEGAPCHGDKGPTQLLHRILLG
jgi:hypothetical protein